jgi:hypothetical protein
VSPCSFVPVRLWVKSHCDFHHILYASYRQCHGEARLDVTEVRVMIFTHLGIMPLIGDINSQSDRLYHE